MQLSLSCLVVATVRVLALLGQEAPVRLAAAAAVLVRLLDGVDRRHPPPVARAVPVDALAFARGRARRLALARVAAERLREARQPVRPRPVGLEARVELGAERVGLGEGGGERAFAEETADLAAHRRRVLRRAASRRARGRSP